MMNLVDPVYSSFSFGDTRLIFTEHDGKLAMTLAPESEVGNMPPHRKVLRDTLPCRDLARCVGYDFPAYGFEPLTQLKLAKDAYADQHGPGNSMRNSESCTRFRPAAQTRNGDTVETRFTDGRGYELTQYVRFLPGAGCFEINTEFVNRSEQAVTLEYLASFSLGMLSPFRPDAGENQYRIHRFRSNWSAECRPEVASAEALGLEASWQGAGVRSLRFGQISSMPVKDFYPFLALEDTQAGVFWGAEIVAPGPWQMELMRRDDFMTLSGGQPDREFGAWSKRLEPGERFSGPAAVAACVRGSFSGLCARLQGWQDENAAALPGNNQDFPVIFNDWCTTWGKPSPDNLRPVIAALKGLDITCFVLDAGWFCSGKSWDATIGDWEVSAEIYPDGLGAFAAEIAAAGFKPGVWFEFENAEINSEVFREHPEYFLRLDGAPIRSGSRAFLDFTRSDVWRYLDDKVVAMLRANRFAYMKVDYNAAIPFGADAPDGAAPAEMLRRHMAAVAAYFEHLRSELPDLVIEICASGGHRLSPHWARFADMISGTDAHEGVEIPLIAAQECMVTAARALQVWATLRPGDDDDRLHYSLAAACMARMVISGNVDGLNEAQRNVLRRALDFFGAVRPILRSGRPEIVHTVAGAWNRPEGAQIFLRRSPEGVLAIVHTFAGAPAELVLDVPGQADALFLPGGVEAVAENGRTRLKNLRPFMGCALRFPAR